MTALSGREMVRNWLETLAWDQVLAHVRPFLEPSADLDLLAFENVMQMLG